MLSIVITSLLMSVDLFLILMLINNKCIYIPFKSYLVLLIISTAILGLSIKCSSLFKNIINDQTCLIISGILFIAIGILQLLSKEENYEKTKSISSKDSCIIGISASIDSIAIGISMGILNYNIYFCILSSLVCNILAIFLSKTFYFKNKKIIEFITAYSFIIIGLFKITKSL